jgi:hypothetical protein
MFISELFTIAKLWKQSRYSTTDEWIKKMSHTHTHTHTHTQECCSAIRTVGVGKWIEWEIIMFSEVSQVQKDKGCMFSLTCGR